MLMTAAELPRTDADRARLLRVSGGRPLADELDRVTVVPWERIAENGLRLGSRVTHPDGGTGVRRALPSGCARRAEAALVLPLGYGGALGRLADGAGRCATVLARYAPVDAPPGGDLARSGPRELPCQPGPAGGLAAARPRLPGARFRPPLSVMRFRRLG